jgi:hypothetical protein
MYAPVGNIKKRSGKKNRKNAKTTEIEALIQMAISLLYINK